MEEKITKMVRLTVDKEIYDFIVVYAKQQRRSVSNYLSFLIEQEIRKIKHQEERHVKGL